MERPPAKPKADESREARLASALRENLRRRKAAATSAPRPKEQKSED